MTEIAIHNVCMYCKKEYKPDIVNHYCDDCVMICTSCDTIKGIWCFDYDYESAAYKEYKAKGAYGYLVKAGRKLICSQCVRDKEDDPVERLRQATAKLKPGQLELMLQSQKK